MSKPFGLHTMKSHQRQRIVAAIGLVVICSGLLLRFIIFNTWSYKYLAMIATFGSQKYGAWGNPDVQVSYEVFSKLAMALVYAGIFLMVASVIAWLFIPPEKTKDENDHVLKRLFSG